MQTTPTIRPPLTTRQFGEAICRSTQTIRAHYCRTGQAFGIRPCKVGRLLLWPADEVAKLLDNSAPSQTS